MGKDNFPKRKYNDEQLLKIANLANNYYRSTV